MVPWHTRVYTPKRYLDRFSRLRRDHYCDRQTDHATPSVTISRTYVVLQCGLKRNIIILCTLQLVKKKQSRRIPTPKVIQLTHTKKQTRPIALHGPLQGSEKAPFFINNHHLVDKSDFSYTLGALFTNNLMMSFRPIQQFCLFQQSPPDISYWHVLFISQSVAVPLRHFKYFWRTDWTNRCDISWCSWHSNQSWKPIWWLLAKNVPNVDQAWLTNWTSGTNVSITMRGHFLLALPDGPGKPGRQTFFGALLTLRTVIPIHFDHIKDDDG